MMTTVQFLKNQIIETRNFTKRLMFETPDELWFTVPENSSSNFAWQVGHILLAQNFHIHTCVFGKDPAILERIPFQTYSRIFMGMGSPNRTADKDVATVSELKELMDFVFDLCVEKLDKANDNMLTEGLEPIPFQHPVAKTKYEALSWSFKHEMWHCAEMELIKIQLGRQFKWIN